jgi:DNA-binding response OmpR family regulator
MPQFQLLIVEDDPAVTYSLANALAQQGYEVTCISEGAEALAYALKAAPHLILLDLRLPDGSGLDVCRQMRQRGLHQPIVILTAQHDEMDKVLGLETGADDYITKPFSLRELLSRIRAQLRRAYGELATDASLLFVGELRIDLARGQVYRDNVPLNLTPIEFKLLAHLARHRRQALTRSQIVEAVWGYDPDLDSERAVNVYVRRLREKIEPDPSRPRLLLTVPGVGYRLVDDA